MEQINVPITLIPFCLPDVHRRTRLPTTSTLSTTSSNVVALLNGSYAKLNIRKTLCTYSTTSVVNGESLRCNQILAKFRWGQHVSLLVSFACSSFISSTITRQQLQYPCSPADLFDSASANENNSWATSIDPHNFFWERRRPTQFFQQVNELSLW